MGSTENDNPIETESMIEKKKAFCSVKLDKTKEMEQLSYYKKSSGLNAG